MDGFEVSLSGHPKRPDGRQREAVLTVQLVEVLAVVLNQLALQAPRQFQALYKRVARVVVPRVVISLEVALSVILAAWIAKPARVVDVERRRGRAGRRRHGDRNPSALPDGIRRLITRDHAGWSTPLQ